MLINSSLAPAKHPDSHILFHMEPKMPLVPHTFVAVSNNFISLCIFDISWHFINLSKRSFM